MAAEEGNKSEVARLRQQYAEEYEAAQRGLSGLAMGSARHAFITRKMANMCVCQLELAKLVGEQEAARLLNEAVDKL